jgi:DNA-binding MarR family transcriptional regulator
MVSAMSAITAKNPLPNPGCQPSGLLSRPWAALSHLRPMPSRRTHAPLTAALDYRLTVRAQMALEAIRSRPGLNNLELSEIIGLSHHSQTSRMMRRLQTQGLAENSQDHANRHVKAWRLTIAGAAVLDAHRRGRALRKAHRKARRHRKLAIRRRLATHPNGTRPTTATGTATTAFRMTTLTREVLIAVANLSDDHYSPSNRDIALAAGGRDEGHISKVLRRMQDQGVLENSGPVTAGAPKAWRLTKRGKDLLSASSSPTAEPTP